MYNPRLDAFVRVAQLGSFTRAAEAFGVTPSAMIQQINNLEKELGVQLFERSRKGVQLTPAGEYLCGESRALIRRSAEIRAKVRNIQAAQHARIRVGTYLLHKLRLFGPLWQAFREKRPECEVEFVDTGAQTTDIGRIDLVECIRDGQPWQRGLSFLQITTTPIVLAVPRALAAAERGEMTMEDLRDKTVVTIRRGMCGTLDRLGEELRANGTRVLEVKVYDLSVFSMCEVNGYYLQIPACWSDLHSGMKAIPCQWDYALPYGFFYKPEASELLRAFIEFAGKEKMTDGR